MANKDDFTGEIRIINKKNKKIYRFFRKNMTCVIFFCVYNNYNIIDK